MTPSSRALSHRRRYIPFQILAVGEQYQDLVFSLRRGEGRCGRLNSGRQRGSRVGNNRGVEYVQEEIRRAVIQRQRTIQDRRAGKCDQPDAVSFQSAD